MSRLQDVPDAPENAGVCGKTADVAGLQDKLTGALIGLARAASGNTPLSVHSPGNDRGAVHNDHQCKL